MEEQPVVKSAGGKTKPWKPAAKPVPLALVDVTPAGHLQTGIEELDRVLGGGLIEGAVVLVGGEPGVGKSTLLLQACERIARQGKKVLYVSGEESARQIKLRALRLGTLSEDLLVLAETDMEAVCQAGDGKRDGQCFPNSGMYSFCAQNCKNNGRYGDFGGACDQGGGHCRPACIGAYGGYRVVF